jgi:hypothetical protein
MEKEQTTLQKIINGPTFGYTDNFPNRGMWEQIVKELNGEFKVLHNSYNGIESHIVSIPYKNRVIRISVSDAKPLKVQIQFDSIQDFELFLSWEDFLERLLKLFQKPEIQIGWKEFDTHYLIKSNRADFVRSTITKDIQTVLLKYNVYSLSYQTNTETMTAEMLCVIQRNVGNRGMILELLEMFQSFIENLIKEKVIK